MYYFQFDNVGKYKKNELIIARFALNGANESMLPNPFKNKILINKGDCCFDSPQRLNSFYAN